MIQAIEGGVCAPKGFLAAGIHCGIRKYKTKKDLSLIVSQAPATAAAVYTRNLVQGAPIAVTKAHLADGQARAVIVNSGIANTCIAGGEATAEEMCALAAGALGLEASDLIVASTGVIGQPLDLEPIRAHMDELVAALSPDGSLSACEGIMTTDTRPKQVAVEFELGGKRCRIGGIAKGSGMIHPDMATMLVFLSTDAAISAPMLQKALSGDIRSSFNMLSVDGDTSTNDMVSILANGLAGNPVIEAEGPDFETFMAALNSVTVCLCRLIAGDGEGATKLLECRVTGAKDLPNARLAARSVISSSLVKAAMFGADANWGRVLCALGYAGAELDVKQVGVRFASKAGEIAVCENGAELDFSEEEAKRILSEDEIDILVSLGDGDAAATAWGCDLTYDYVKINGEYRS